MTLPIRGVHVDCRAQMLRFPRIRGIFADLARWGFNTVLFEYENRFPYGGRLKRVAAPDALTRGEVRDLNRLAADLGLRIMPLVQCLGHLEYVLRLPGLSRHAEQKGDPFRENARAAYAVCPSRQRAESLFRDMAEQIIEMHPGIRHFHMGGDEVELAGDCPRCGPRLEREGLSRVLVGHYAKCAEWLRDQGPEPIIWGDLVLAHPQDLPALRGLVTIMDWDYWSGTQPLADPRIWGLNKAAGADPRRPRTWPAPLQRFAAYAFAGGRKLAAPFPYARFLRDQGFPVILASAARCHGDNFCVPSPHHLDNVLGAAGVAHETNILGSVITSWAVRRAPWPLTENILMAGAAAMQERGVSRRALDKAFAAAHFGAADPRLAAIPLLLGANVPNLSDSLPGIDYETGRWPGKSMDARLAAISAPAADFARRNKALRDNVRKAEALLARARPLNRQQRERVALWKWAARSLRLIAEFGDLAIGEARGRDATKIARLRRELMRLRGETRSRLGRIYTEWTMLDELQTRLDTYVQHLELMLKRNR